jgi:hypothetical protein
VLEPWHAAASVETDGRLTMKSVRVRYTVRPDFVEANKANVRAVMEELRAKGDSGVHYSAHVEPDGVSFVHLVILRDEEASKVIPSLEAFGRFREALRGGAVSPPASEDWEVVGSNFVG